MRSRFTLIPVVLALAAGCGSAASHDYNPPFVSLSGVITSSSIVTPSQVRVALVWKHRDPDGNLLRSAQELAVEAQFPVRFRLDITSLPPTESMNPADPNFRYATGTLIVYEDTDGNGVLDLVRSDVESTVDRVLGAPEHLSVFYVEGSAVQRGGPGAQPGFNLRREPLMLDPPPGDSQCQAVQAGSREYLPLSTEIPIALTAAPELSREMCAVMPPAPDGGCSGSSCPSSVPPGAQVTCSSDRMAFVYKSCESAGGLCGSVSCQYVCGRRLPSDPIPPDWPCQ
jgi:hypothetical protein